MTLPSGWTIARAPDAVAGAPPPGAIWAVSAESGAATEICSSEAEATLRAWKLQARLDRMLEDMRRKEAA